MLQAGTAVRAWEKGARGRISVSCSQLNSEPKTASKGKSMDKEIIFNLWEHVNTILSWFCLLRGIYLFLKC